MNTFILSNQLRLGISQALLLVYRYLTSIYKLGDLSYVQFLSGFMRGINYDLADSKILTVSGNGIGELEKMLCFQWSVDHIETMSVYPSQIGIMRFLTESSPEEVEKYFNWAYEFLEDYPNIQSILDSPGLIAYWQEECELWKSSELKDRVQLFGGSPWELRGTEIYDLILLSHSQKLLLSHNAKDLLPLLKPGGFLASMMPIIFYPDSLNERIPQRFSDLYEVKTAKEKIIQETRSKGYEIEDANTVHINWTFSPDDIIQIVTFTISSPLRSLIIGELLIQLLSAELPDSIRLLLLESALSNISPYKTGGTEALRIMITMKGD